MSSPPLYTSVPSTDPSEVPTQPSEPPLPAFDHSDMDAKRPRIPLYPLLILFLHLLIALRLFPISETIYLLLFIFFSVTLSLLHDQLVFLFARPATTLDFWRERWKAVNTQLAGVFIAGGFLAVPKDGDWSDARTAFTILGGFLVVIAAVILNAGELKTRRVSRERR
ncbi:hypothetical protein BDY24DRAFT_187651 [Mrakia frigida]|uniref:uncharacterized protein n=1 Tax=Mrakia frigida TaxID=29902 RepID=UPI003FCBF12D